MSDERDRPHPADMLDCPTDPVHHDLGIGRPARTMRNAPVIDNRLRAAVRSYFTAWGTLYDFGDNDWAAADHWPHVKAALTRMGRLAGVPEELIKKATKEGGEQ